MRRKLFLLSSGRLERESNTIAFVPTSGEDRKFVPIKGISSIYAFGELDLNKRVLELLAKEGIPLHLFNYYGHYVGSFLPRRHYNAGIVTLRQSEHYLDPGKRLYLARQFVVGSLRNLEAFLRYYGSRGIELEEDIRTISRLRESAAAAGDVEELMGIEGNAREVYYGAWNSALPEEFRYSGRTRRPPRSRLDALISMGNSLLYAAVLDEIHKTHVDPRIGYLHSTSSRKFSLNLDISDVFKPALVDRSIFSLVNRSALGDDDFSPDLGGILLSEGG
ncbi:MAG: type I-B CRISPR-associated endonuclease Cas1b, partial [Conexivisphaera sp.]